MKSMNLVLSRDQVRRVDQLAVERYKIPGLVLMENAGRNAADIICGVYGSRGKALIVCGTGNNGGDGCVIARHLHNVGWAVRLMVGSKKKMTQDAATNFAIAEAMAIDARVVTDVEDQCRMIKSVTEDEVIIDALLGTGFKGEVREPMAGLIHAINRVKKRGIVAIDTPSGLDCQTGEPCEATVIADHTITFVAVKSGFERFSAKPYIGKVTVADIGAPRELIEVVRELGTI